MFNYKVSFLKQISTIEAFLRAPFFVGCIRFGLGWSGKVSSASSSNKVADKMVTTTI